MTINPAVNIIVTYIVLMIIALNYNAVSSSKIFASIFACVILVASEVLITYSACIILDTSIVTLLADEISSLYLFALSRFIPFIFMRIVRMMIIAYPVNADKSKKLKIAEVLIIVALPVASLQQMYFLYEVSKDLVGKPNINVAIAIIVIIFFNMIFYLLYLKIIKMSRYEVDMALEERLMEYYHLNYDELKRSLDEVRKFKHDARHIVWGTLSEFLAGREDEEIEKLILKLNQAMEELYLETYQCYTRNVALDIILNHTISKAETYAIKVELQISPELEVNLDNKVLTVVLGNILDNAIEASLQNEYKLIVIEIFNTSGNLYIGVTNFYNGSLQFEDGLPKTSKVDTKNHGIGLRSIERLVAENQGIMWIDAQNGKFIVGIHFINV